MPETGWDSVEPREIRGFAYLLDDFAVGLTYEISYDATGSVTHFTFIVDSLEPMHVLDQEVDTIRGRVITNGIESRPITLYVPYIISSRLVYPFRSQALPTTITATTAGTTNRTNSQGITLEAHYLYKLWYRNSAGRNRTCIAKIFSFDDRVLNNSEELEQTLFVKVYSYNTGRTFSIPFDSIHRAVQLRILNRDNETVDEYDEQDIEDCGRSIFVHVDAPHIQGIPPAWQGPQLKTIWRESPELLLDIFSEE